MKRERTIFNQVLFAAFLLMMVSCGSSNPEPDPNPDPIPTPEEVVTIAEFTLADAIDAYDAFNTNLYDPNRRVYFRDTDKNTQLIGWTQAIMWEMSINAYEKTRDPKYLKLMNDLYAGYYTYLRNFDWWDTREWNLYDDMMWWVIAFAHAYEVTGDEKYLKHSEDGFNRCWYYGETNQPKDYKKGSYDFDNGGGMFWDWKFGRIGKMSCINYPTIIAAVRLHNIYKGKGDDVKSADFLAKAKDVYDWSYNNIFNKTNGAVADSKHLGNADAAWTMHLYNQGTCIGAGAMLYKATNEQKYLDHAVLAAKYTKIAMSTSDGMIACENDGDYSLTNEKGIYVPIFGQYMAMLIKDCGQGEEFLPWFRKSINTGWHNRDSRGLTYKNHGLKAQRGRVFSSYDASGIPALMWLCPTSSMMP